MFRHLIEHKLSITVSFRIMIDRTITPEVGLTFKGSCVEILFFSRGKAVILQGLLIQNLPYKRDKVLEAFLMEHDLELVNEEENMANRENVQGHG